MQLAARIVYAVVSLGIAGCTGHLIYWFLTSPASLKRWSDEHVQGRDMFLRGVYWVAAFIGIALAASGGIESALGWMPRSWVNFDEDGNKEWVASSIAHTAGFMIALFAMAKGGELAKRVRDLEERVKEPR